MWKDITSYSQNDKDRVPNCWLLNVGKFRISLVWNSLYCPNTWSTSLSGIYNDRSLELPNYTDFEKAQTQALLITEKVFSDALDAIQKLKPQNMPCPTCDQYICVCDRMGTP